MALGIKATRLAPAAHAQAVGRFPAGTGHGGQIGLLFFGYDKRSTEGVRGCFAASGSSAG